MSQRLLRGNDFSYGVYLYHRPFIYAATGVGLSGWLGFLVVGIVTVSARVGASRAALLPSSYTT